MTRAEDRRDQVRRHLTELPELYALLPMFLIPGVGATDDDRHAVGGNPSRPPVNLQVADLLDTREKPDSEAQRTDYELDRRIGARRQGILPNLVSWTRLVDGELHDADIGHQPPADTPTLISECGFLLEHLDWCTEQRWFDELERDVKDMRSDIRNAVHWGDEAPLTCLVPGCGWDIQAMDNGTWYRCTGCGKAWSRLELHRIAERRRPRLLAECADLTGVSVRSLRYAIKAGDLKPAGRDRNADLFDLQDATMVAARIKLQLSREQTRTRG